MSAQSIREVSGFAIEKNVPIPAHPHRKPGGFMETLRNMEAGDSVFYPSEHDRNVVARISSSVSAISRRNERKFTYRTVDGGYRIWRLS